jgi:hypothetical protein
LEFNKTPHEGIGVDGLPGPNGGIQAVMDGKLDATLLYPTGGSLAISLSWEILKGKTVKKENREKTSLRQVHKRNYWRLTASWRQGIVMK